MKERNLGVLMVASLALAAVACGGAQAASAPYESYAEEETAYRGGRVALSSGGESVADYARGEPSPVVAASEPPSSGDTAEVATTAEPAEPGTEQAQDAATRGPLLIYTADINLAVHEVRERMASVVEIADGVGGFLQRQDDTVVIVRVPASQFRAALTQIEEVGDVLHRRVNAQDVSEEFRDTRIRLRNALAMRDRMAELLDRAGNVAESLAIQRELERLTQEIELYRGRLNSLQDRIAFSTITVRFQPIQVDSQVPRERFRLPFPFLNRLGLPALMDL